MGPRSRKAGHHKTGGHGDISHDKNRPGQGISKAPQLNRKPSSLSRQISEKKDNSYNSNTIGGPWSPQPATAFKALLSARFCAAVWSSISDCDETFNYWEPVHYLIHGSGLQTWEYSPVYAIRSYAYLWLYAFPALLYTQLLQSNKVLVFYYLRCILAFCCALCETYYYKGLLRHFGPNVARLALCFMLLSCGMFISSTAFLPSTFSMYMVYLVYGAWLQQHFRTVILATAASVLVGWPFSGLLCLPVAIDLILTKKRRIYLIKWGLIIGIAIMGPLIAIDSYYYGKLVIAPFNIVMYNVFSSHGANLYGTEPFYYYFLNCFLNFNVIFLAAFTALPIMLICKFIVKSKRNIVNSSHWICLSGLLLWFLVFVVQSHKEERFMFPAYPLLCLCAAFSIEMVHKSVTYLVPRLAYIYSSLVLLFVFVSVFLSISRGLALYKGFHAPFDTWMELGKIHHDLNITKLKNPVNVCVGKEWHRFPNSFFLPDSTNWKVRFIESEFRGQLPKPYSETFDGTRIIPTDMNHLNVEEPSRYINTTECHFLIDTDHREYGPRDPPYSKDTENWEILISNPFLDTMNSPVIWRAFYLPFITEAKCSYVNYNLLKNKKIQVI